MAEAGDVAAAIERLRSEMLHAPLCPITPCTCQRFADLALLAQAAQAGGGDCVECVAKQFRIDALQESIDGCAKRVAALSGERAVTKLLALHEECDDDVPCSILSDLRALLAPPAPAP